MARESESAKQEVRFAGLEDALRELESRLQRMERGISGAGATAGNPGLPGFYLPAVTWPAMLAPANAATTTRCFDDVQTAISGTFDYKSNVEPKEECPPPTPADKARAVLEARKNLLAFGATWCAAGKDSCLSGDCVPTLSGIRVDRYELGNRPAGDDKTCFVTAHITGTVSCNCS